MVEDLEEEGLEYETDEEPLEASYHTPPIKEGRSSPSTCIPLRSPTPEGSDPENNGHLQTKLIESQIKAFLEEAEEDLELNNFPLLENLSPIPVCAPLPEGFVAFPVSISQHYVPSKGLPHPGYYHPYHFLVKGQCHCEPGGWHRDSSCSSGNG